MTRTSISSLPVAPSTQLLIHRLTPDPHTPSPAAFRTTVLSTAPSIQRRARLLAPSAHFSYVTPFPVPFPYDIRFPTDNKAAHIETWLTDREAIHPQLNKYYSKNRDQPRILIGLSELALRDCLPNLHVGDAFSTLGAPSLSNPFADDGDPTPSDVDELVQPRQDLIDVLSGHAVLMSTETTDDPHTGFAPWSLRYSGHQFGNWAGQLGDGRAVSICKLDR